MLIYTIVRHLARAKVIAAYTDLSHAMRHLKTMSQNMKNTLSSDGWACGKKGKAHYEIEETYLFGLPDDKT